MTDTNLAASAVSPKSGEEPFTAAGHPIGATVADFWRWSSSDLLGNAMRGVVAEYLVGVALDAVGGRARAEWDAVDLRTATGLAVEVKSAAYLQTWSQRELSKIVFGIAPRVGWDATTNTYHTHYRRHSDVFVFCLLAHTDKASVDPLNTDQWRFHVVPTRVLDDKVGDQKTIGLSRLLALQPAIVPYAGLRAAVEAAGTAAPPRQRPANSIVAESSTRAAIGK